MPVEGVYEERPLAAGWGQAKAIKKSLHVSWLGVIVNYNTILLGTQDGE
jgi:hypothetical protein